MNRTNVGEALLAMRKKRLLSIETLAFLSSVDQGTISRIERGKTNTRVLTLYRLLHGMDASLLELLMFLGESFLKKEPGSSLEELDRFLYDLTHAREETCQLLAQRINGIEKNTWTRCDVEHVLVDSLFYDVVLKYPEAFSSSALHSIAFSDEIVFLEDVNAFLHQEFEEVNVFTDLKSSFLHGQVFERLTFLHVFDLDQEYGWNGQLLCMIWKACLFEEYFVQRAGEKKAAKLFLFVKRWESYEK